MTACHLHCRFSSRFSLKHLSPPQQLDTICWRAQSLLNEGADLYDRGNFTEALGRFQSAYAAFPSPKLWFNIGQAERDLGRHVGAMQAFERFLSEAKDAPSGTLGEAHRSVSELRLKLGHITISCATHGAIVSVDGTRVGITPLPGLLWLEPGTHQIGVGRYDLVPAVQRIEVVPGREATITFQLHVAEAKLPAVVPAPPAPVPTAAAAAPAPAPALPPSAVIQAPTLLVVYRRLRGCRMTRIARVKPRGRVWFATGGFGQVSAVL